MRQTLISLCLVSAIASPAFAADKTPQQRISELEARVKTLEANAEALRTQAADAVAAAKEARAAIEEMKAAPPATAVASEAPAANEAPAEAPAPETASANGNAFNPAISIILNGAYGHHSLNPNLYSRAGFPLAGGAGPGPQGISLGESEVSFAANIDDKLYGQLTLTAEDENGETHVGVEEAFIDTTTLPHGFSLRAGRFYSNIGYLNSHHAHTDFFYDRPLAYQAFLGNQYGDDGVQLRWVAPTDLFLEFGGEVFRGQNYPSGGAAHAGAGVKTLFAHAGGDVGVESSWLAGVSMLKANSDNTEDGFTGASKLYIADATWKWAPQGNFKDGGVTVRGEYFRENRDGQFTDTANPMLDQPWVGTRNGYYLEGVYRINRSWDAGYRYDHLSADRSGPYASSYDPVRNSLMLTWLNSEFSLVRLQYSQDKPNPTDIDNILTLQYQVSLGAHGAHKF